MAEGSVEEDSGDMLGPTAAPTLETSAPSSLSVRDEVSSQKIEFSQKKQPEKDFDIKGILFLRKICFFFYTSADQ